MSSDTNTIKIPPGARARFEVQVRAPSQEFLKDDISHLLMSGLILSTNLGDVMPIFAVVEALQGQLHASHLEPLQFEGGNDKYEVSKGSNVERKIMHVPLELTWNDHRDIKKESRVNAITIPPAKWSTSVRSEANLSYSLGHKSLKNGVPLYLRSSFSRNVRLLSVDSCNPWFRFVPLESTKRVENSSDNGVFVGLIRTNVDCSSNHSTEGGLPSFYQCMLNWLSHRLKLQPEGCGVKDSNLKLRQIDSVKRTIEVGLRRLKKSYKTYFSSDPIYMDFGAMSSWNESDLSHIKTGRRKDDGLIPDLASYNAIWKALQIANNFGYNLLSSSLRATVEYDSEPLNGIEENSWSMAVKQNLSLSINDLDIQSVLEVPKLFDSDNEYLEFQPTVVGSVTHAVISVRNPTGVPVRVRIGTSNALDGASSSSLPFSSIEELNRIKTMQNPYVQNGKSSVPRNDSTSFSWWDGYGAFFIPDEHGDVIRSHNNISVTGGGGSTSISLVNPSLNSQIGFLVGCGKRCGLREKSSANVALGNPVSNSPIGASAAAGITLRGNFRHNSPETNDKEIAEPIIFAGGTPVSISDGPAAFAIPFSALDEIVIPPFGKGQLGPIYFRPPGRHKAVGCELARQSGAKLDEKKEILCGTQTFDSLLYLENSLTGIEKIGLRGQSVWDNLYFVDPPPKEGEDAFGDIEFRDGMPTLFFSGTSNTVTDFIPKASLFGKMTQHLSVVKEVVLQNGGDNDSYISAVSLWGMNDVREEEVSCSYGSFKLLNCWEFVPNWEHIRTFDAVNIQTGFLLKPGENRSLFIEHLPDCKTKKEFVNLHVRLSNDNSQKPSELRHPRSRGLKNPFAKKEINMFFGYQMDGPAFGRCNPVDRRLSGLVIHTDSTSMNSANYSSRIELKKFGRNREESPLLLFQVFLFSTAAWMLCYALRARFQAIRNLLQRTHGEPAKNVLNWNAAFRCLARSHPTSTELQTISGEQMRHDVIGRYKAKGNTSSPSLNSTNGFSRDRRAAISNTLRHRLGKESGPGNERIRPFSDALFHDTSIVDDSSLRIHFPIGLGWRTAYSRGIIKDNSLLPTSFASRTKILLSQRGAVTFEKSGENCKEKGDVEKKHVVKTSSIEERKRNLTSSLSSAEIANGTENEVSKSDVVESANMTSIFEFKETKSSKPKTNHINGSESVKEINTIIPVGENERAPVPKKVEIIITTTQKEIPSKLASKMEKQSKKKPEVPMQPSKNIPATDVLKRNQKPKNQAPKTKDCENSNKMEIISKNAPWGQNEKPRVPAKSQSTLLGPLPKLGTSVAAVAWDAEHQKVDTSSLPGKKEEVITADEKSKTKDKPRKKTAKQHVQGKKVDSTQAINKRTVSEVPVGTVPQTKQLQRQTILTPPPGFGDHQFNATLPPNGNAFVSLSANGNAMLSSSASQSQLSLEKMLNPALTGGSNDADISLGVPSQVTSATLPFSHTNAGSSALLFTGSIHESNASPSTLHGFNVVDVAMATENPIALAPGAEEPWRPPLLNELLNEETEHVEQPWLPALLNDDTESGFDVVDFLNGILQDGSPAEEEPALERKSSTPVTPASIMTGTVGNATTTTPVSDNPWARESQASRAAAYGISFDDEEGNNAKSPATGLKKTIAGGLEGSIPLLTPTTILNAGEDEKVISFYEGLLDE